MKETKGKELKKKLFTKTIKLLSHKSYRIKFNSTNKQLFLCSKIIQLFLKSESN